MGAAGAFDKRDMGTQDKAPAGARMADRPKPTSPSRNTESAPTPPPSNGDARFRVAARPIFHALPFLSVVPPSRPIGALIPPTRRRPVSLAFARRGACMPLYTDFPLYYLRRSLRGDLKIGYLRGSHLPAAGPDPRNISGALMIMGGWKYC